MPRVLGHEVLIKNLAKLAAQGDLSHGYIFEGPSMVGKRTAAQALAHLLEKGVFEVPANNEILQDSMTIDLVYAKALDPNVKDSIGIDAVREIKNFLWQKPNVSPRRTLIIDDAELLTTEAQNALLKITEEPPASSLLIIIASDLQSLMGTITSRLQRIAFGGVAEAEIAEWLVTDGEVKKADAAIFARRSLGKPGLAWRLSHDKDFRDQIAQAEAFLKTTPAGRKDFIKKLIEPDDFNMRKFLDAVIIALAWEKPSKAKAALWHKTLGLYRDMSNFSLNPRLQLENLLLP